MIIAYPWSACKPLDSIQRLVHECICIGIAFPGDMRYANLLELLHQSPGLQEQLLEPLASHLVLTIHLTNHKLGVGKDLQVSDAAVECRLKASDERVILGNVIGGIPNTIPYLLQHLTRLVPENDSNGSRAGITPGAPIHEQRTIAIPTLEIHASRFRGNHFACIRRNHRHTPPGRSTSLGKDYLHSSLLKSLTQALAPCTQCPHLQ